MAGGEGCDRKRSSSATGAGWYASGDSDGEGLGGSIGVDDSERIVEDVGREQLGAVRRKRHSAELGLGAQNGGLQWAQPLFRCERKHVNVIRA